MRFRVLFLSLLAATGLMAGGHRSTLTWSFKPTEGKISLVMADGQKVSMDPRSVLPMDATKWFSSWKLYFSVPGPTSDTQVIGSPIEFDLGTINPKQVVNPFNLVKLEQKEGKRNWVMKITKADFFPLEGSEVIPVEQRPLPVKAVDGHYRLSIPKALPPGEYALFTDVEAWEFTVKPDPMASTAK